MIFLCIFPNLVRLFTSGRSIDRIGRIGRIGIIGRRCSIRPSICGIYRICSIGRIFRICSLI